MMQRALPSCFLLAMLGGCQAQEDLAGFSGDDECASDGCALHALQSRARSMSENLNWAVQAAAQLPGLEDPDLSDILPDPTDPSEAEEDDAEEESGMGLCGSETYDKSIWGCCADSLFPRKTEACCGGEIYDVEHGACCDGKDAYDVRTQGCCNGNQVFDKGNEYMIFALQCLAPVEPEDTKMNFTCAAQWPPLNYAKVWAQYCSIKSQGHMAWAMTPSCEVGWLSVKQGNVEDAQKKALEQCQQRSSSFDKEKCHVFDVEGKNCQRQRCGKTLYDATMIGCCNGQIYDLRSQDCCSGHIYETKTTGCCNGRMYKKEPRRCCGGKHLFNSNTHGCCLEGTPSIFRFGSQNCCAAPSGICRIPPGIESCCRKEGRHSIN